MLYIVVCVVVYAVLRMIVIVCDVWNTTWRSGQHVSCHVMSCHVMSCHVMSYHVMSCHIMSCHVISCCSIYVLCLGCAAQCVTLHNQCSTGQHPRDTPGVCPVPSVGQHMPIAPAASHALLAEQEDFKLAFASTTCTEAL